MSFSTYAAGFQCSVSKGHEAAFDAIGEAVGAKLAESADESSRGQIFQWFRHATGHDCPDLFRAWLNGGPPRQT